MSRPNHVLAEQSRLRIVDIGSHKFEPSADAYKCRVCGRPPALHEDTGFRTPGTGWPQQERPRR